jgi:hypothetical protein
MRRAVHGLASDRYRLHSVTSRCAAGRHHIDSQCKVATWDWKGVVRHDCGQDRIRRAPKGAGDAVGSVGGDAESVPGPPVCTPPRAPVRSHFRRGPLTDLKAGTVRSDAGHTLARLRNSAQAELARRCTVAQAAISLRSRRKGKRNKVNARQWPRIFA